MGLQRSLIRHVLGYIPSQPLPVRSVARIARGAYARHLPPEPLRIPRNARVAVVGNGSARPDDSPAIDGHDVVVRFNACGNYGVSGWRCDVLALCINGPPGRKFAHGKNLNPLAAGLAKELWLADPEGSEGNWGGSICRRMPDKPYQYLGQEMCDEIRETLERLGARTDQHPSTGIKVLAHLRRFAPITVTLFGFTHSGNNVHPWDAERRLVDQWSDWISRARP